MPKVRFPLAGRRARARGSSCDAPHFAAPNVLASLDRRPPPNAIFRTLPMKLLVIGAGMMGSAAAYDMARQSDVTSVTIADSDLRRARGVAARINRMRRARK